MLTNLICPLRLHNVFKHFRKQEPVSNFRLNSCRFLYRGDLTDKFLVVDIFLKNR